MKTMIPVARHLAVTRRLAVTRPARFAFLLLLVFSVSPAARGADEPVPEKYRLYIGTYTGGRSQSQGIYTAVLDLATGAIGQATLAAESLSPSFLAIHPNRRFLYAVNETPEFADKTSGGVSSYAIDPDTGKLQFLNVQPSRGDGPCHLVVDKAGRNVLIANYGGGSVASFPIAADGTLKEAASFIQHTGSSVGERQQGPHAHSINLDAANRFAAVADLGLDKVLVYRFDSSTGKLTPNDPPSVALKPGAGPRHFAFHPSGTFAYVINEIDLTVTAFRYDAQGGVLSPIQTITTLADGVQGHGLSTAEVVVHPSGKFLYGSNRGHNTIVVYTIDQASGQLTYVEHQSTQGRMPRNFFVEPTGKFLLAENHDTDNVVVFKIDQQTGELTSTGNTLKVPMPVCIRVVPIP